MVNLGMIIAAVLGLGGLLFLVTAKKEGVSVGREIGELGTGIGELGLGAGRGIAGAVGTPIFTLTEALRGIFSLGADIQRGLGVLPPKTEDRAGARPPPVERFSGFGVLEVGDIVEVIQQGLYDFGRTGTIESLNGFARVTGEGWTHGSLLRSELREIEDRSGARAI